MKSFLNTLMVDAPADGGTPAGGTGTGTPASGGEWYAGADPVTIGTIQNKGWKGPLDAVTGYMNAEKLIGAPPEQIIRLPKADAPDYDAQMEAVYGRLGRPTDGKGYNIPVPEGQDPAFSQAAAATFHKLGLNAKQGENVAKWFNEYSAQRMTEITAQETQALETAKAGLKKDWGGLHEKNVAIAGAVARSLGVSAEQISALEGTIGYAAVMKMFHTIATQLGEDKFVAPGHQGGENTTPEMALARIDQLKRDPEWARRYTNGGAAETREFARLHAIAYPNQQQS